MIKTQNLVVREFHPNDVTSIHDIALKKGFHFYSLDGTKENAQAFVERSIALAVESPRNSFKMAVACKKTPNNCIGYVAFDDLLNPSRTNGTPDIGYLIDPAYQGHGYATEAMAGLMRHCYATHPNLDDAWLTVHPENIASQKVSAKLGFNRVSNEIFQMTYGPRFQYHTDKKALRIKGIL